MAAANVSLNALDRAVPPRHVDFAVVERETGRTLFHSDGKLAMTTNFVEDAGRDPALRSLLRSGARDTIDLVYTGVPVRAHVGPLRPGLPWTLVVYRGHELEDRVAALTATLSIGFTVVCVVLVALLAGILLFGAHCLRPEALAGIPVTLGRVMAAGSHLAWPCAAGVLVLLLYSPWIARHAWTLAGASPVLPFFAVCSILAVAALVGWCSFAEPPATTGDGTVRRVFGLAALVAVLAAAPPALWFVHHRAALGVGLNHYLMDQTLDSVDRAREDYRLDVLRRHGAGAAPAGDRARRRFREEPELHEGWLLRALRPIVAVSELANQLMAYRALPPASAGPGRVAARRVLQNVRLRRRPPVVGALGARVRGVPDPGRVDPLRLGAADRGHGVHRLRGVHARRTPAPPQPEEVAERGRTPDVRERKTSCRPAVARHRGESQRAVSRRLCSNVDEQPRSFAA